MAPEKIGELAGSWPSRSPAASTRISRPGLRNPGREAGGSIGSSRVLVDLGDVALEAPMPAAAGAVVATARIEERRLEPRLVTNAATAESGKASSRPVRQSCSVGSCGSGGSSSSRLVAAAMSLQRSTAATASDGCLREYAWLPSCPGEGNVSRPMARSSAAKAMPIATSRTAAWRPTRSRSWQVGGRAALRPLPRGSPGRGCATPARGAPSTR